MSNCTILDPVTTVNASSGTVIRIKSYFKILMDRYGTNETRLRLTRTLDSLQNVTDVDEDFVVVRVFFFDRFESARMRLEGIRTSEDSEGQLVRAYCRASEDIEPDDYILINYDDPNYDEKYLVVEKEDHEVGNCVIFHTLYLRRIDERGI